MHRTWTIDKQGMYDPQFEHDACGIALLAHINGNPSHSIVSKSLIALQRLDHRGGRGANNSVGDGAGILTQIPHKLFQTEWKRAGKLLMDAGKYGIGMFFLPKQEDTRKHCEEIIGNIIESEKLEIIRLENCANKWSYSKWASKRNTTSDTPTIYSIPI